MFFFDNLIKDESHRVMKFGNGTSMCGDGIGDMGVSVTSVKIICRIRRRGCIVANGCMRNGNDWRGSFVVIFIK